MPSCSINCVIITHPSRISSPVGAAVDEPLRPPVLMRQSRTICSICIKPTSFSNYRYCYECAPINTIEYNYYHRNCEN
jgi:hypothetical protein